MLPHPHLHLAPIIAALDYTGIAIASIGGALRARHHPRHHYDIVGVLGLALVSALGGGMLRDVLLNQGPPLALTNIWYLYTAFAAALLAIFLGHRLSGARATTVMLTVDSAAISLFAVAGAARADAFHLSWLPAVLLGLTTAVGGGSLRDVLSGSTPRVFERGNLYALAALFAAIVWLLLDRTSLLPDSVSTALAVLAGFALRTASLRFNWQTPTLRLRRPTP